jgi:hypothetical protein
MEDKRKTKRQRVSDLSDKLVVMSRKASDFLKDIYAVPEEKIAFIHHGIPDTPFIDSSFNKDKFGVDGVFNIGCVGIMVDCHNFADKEILR